MSNYLRKTIKQKTQTFHSRHSEGPRPFLPWLVSANFPPIYDRCLVKRRNSFYPGSPGKLPRPRSSKAAANHDALLWDDLFHVCMPHTITCSAVCSFPKNLNLSFISPGRIFPVALWSVSVLSGKLQACSDNIFGEHCLPAMDAMPPAAMH